jgi:hypothetical protein
MSYEHPHVTGEIPGIPKQPNPGDRRKLPLTVYIGGVRRIVGEAVIEDDGRVEAYIDPKADIGQALIDLVTDGVLQTVSIAFDAPPATPWIDPKDPEHIQWLKNY